MAWQFLLTDEARSQLREWDRGMIEELRTRLARLAEDAEEEGTPMPELRRASPDDPPDLLVYVYWSSHQHGMEVRVYFDPHFVHESQIMYLIGLRRRSHDPDDHWS